jgi:hypothetical protein
MGIATTTAGTAIRQLSDLNSQGTGLGSGIADLIGFYVTNAATQMVAQSSVIGSFSMSTGAGASSSTGAYGFGNSQTANAVVNAIQQLKIMGLIG